MSADMAKAKGTVKPTKPKYIKKGCTAIIQWFCRSGFGPGPSKGGLARTMKGLAIVATMPTKKS